MGRNVSRREKSFLSSFLVLKKARLNGEDWLGGNRAKIAANLREGAE